MVNFTFFLKAALKHLSVGLSFYLSKSLFKKQFKRYFPDKYDKEIEDFLNKSNEFRSKFWFNFAFISIITFIVCLLLSLFGKFGNEINHYFRAIALIILFTGSTSRLSNTDMTFGMISIPELLDGSLFFTSQFFSALLLMFALWL